MASSTLSSRARHPAAAAPLTSASCCPMERVARVDALRTALNLSYDVKESVLWKVQLLAVVVHHRDLPLDAPLHRRLALGSSAGSGWRQAARGPNSGRCSGAWLAGRSRPRVMLVLACSITPPDVKQEWRYHAGVGDRPPSSGLDDLGISV